MKFRIEHESSRKVCFEDYLENTKLLDEVVLKIIMEKQLLTNWCWAAISTTLGHYYNTGQWTQIQIANHILDDNLKDADLNNLDTNINRQETLDEGLKFVGCYSHWSLGKPSYERIAYEINAARPLCLRLEWFGGGAHYVIIKGVNVKSQQLYIEDPMYGSSVVFYKGFPRDYIGAGGIWTDTFWTCFPEQKLVRSNE